MNENKKDNSKVKRQKSAEELEKEEEERKLKVDSLEKAGKIAQEVKAYIKPKIKQDQRVYDLVESTEAKIRDLGGECAFPVNVSINNIAAHYTSPLRDDNLVIQSGDIVKLDLGVHIEGYIVDTALTVSFNDDKALGNIIQSTEVAVEAAIMMVKPELNTHEIGKKTESIVKGFGYNPIKELGGHQIERWKVHGQKQVPELGSQGGDIVEEGDVLAIEIFASTGRGSVHSTNASYIYELNPYTGRVPLRRKASKQLLGFITKNYKTLPFAERWLAKEFQFGIAFGLEELVRTNKLKAHYVLSEEKGFFVSQTEQTVLVTEDGCRQLT
ncbi:MAG: type II methionyl aminopeptidase [Promethearchaeota archaeon]|nr:MAG: type II methionyl aminopeptidase [Candidatus Lokiarchaeota archaeon]